MRGAVLRPRTNGPELCEPNEPKPDTHVRRAMRKVHALNNAIRRDRTRCPVEPCRTGLLALAIFAAWWGGPPGPRRAGDWRLAGQINLVFVAAAAFAGKWSARHPLDGRVRMNISHF